MNDKVMINDHKINISTKNIRSNDNTYTYFIAKMNLERIL